MTGRLQSNTEYTVTHLYGTDVLKTDAGADTCSSPRTSASFPATSTARSPARVG